MNAPSPSWLLVSHWRLQPGLLSIGALYVLFYLLGATRVRGEWPLHRTACFVAGVGTVVVALCSGLDAYDDRMLSVHMVQHMVLLMVAPLLLIGGRPTLLALRALPPGARRWLAASLTRSRSLTGPVACLLVFSAVVILTHVPGFYDATLRQPALHDTEHLVYVIAGGLMWWPLLGGDPLPSRRLSGLASLLYLLGAMVPMALVGAYLNRLSSLAYPAYAAPAHALGLSPLTDQAQAGAIMWVGGDTLMIVAGLWAAMATMVGEERRQQAREARLDAREAAL